MLYIRRYPNVPKQNEPNRWRAQGKELSREARVRLDWMDFYHRCRNVARTCRHFGISRQTFYRWHRRYNSYNLTTLEARSPPPSSPPPAHLVSPPGRSRPGFRSEERRVGKERIFREATQPQNKQ